MGALGLLVTGLGGLLLLLTLAGCGFCIHAGFAVGRYAGRRSGRAGQLSVTVLKPLHGDEPGLADSLLGYLTQDYGAPMELRLGVQSSSDPALAVAEARRAASSDQPVRVVLDPSEHGANRKVSNLINLERSAPLGELVVQSDSDIAVQPDYLGRLNEALAAPGVGVASCLYHGDAATGALAARLGAMGVSYQSLPLFAVGVSTGATPCMGSTIAMRRETLAAIGAFESVKDVLADDYEIGARVRALGLKSIVPPFLVAHRSAEATLGELWRHEVRWSKTVKDINPAGHVGSVVTHPLALALIAWAWLSGAQVGWAWLGGFAVLLALCARLWLKSRVDRVAAANGQAAATGPWWLLPPRDMMSFAVFVGAFFARRVEWRGARFHVGRDGGLTPV